MIDIQDCSFVYKRGAKAVTDHFSLSISRGGVYGLLGSNGAGKTTLLLLVAGLLKPSGGKVTFDGVDTFRRLPETLQEIFLVPEEFGLPDLSLMKFAELYSKLYPRFSMEDMLENLKVFDLDPQINLKAVSMGQKKKALLSFALACNTRLVLLDEPTNGLDIPGKTAFRRLISRAETEGRVFIVSTHQVRDVGQILDHLLILDNSHVLLNATIDDVQSRLRFVNSFDKEIAEGALYSERTMGMTSAILPNDSDEETEINLELLFNFAHDCPDKFASLFSDLASSEETQTAGAKTFNE